MKALVLVVAILLLAACPSVQVTPPKRAKDLPTQFVATAQGPSVASLDWSTFFADETLNALVAESLDNNLDLAMAAQRIETARTVVKERTGAMLPRLDMSSTAGVRKFGLYTMDGAGNATTEITPGELVPVNLGDFSIGLVSSWELDIWGRRRAEHKAAQRQYLASVDGARAVYTSLIADVAQAYFELMAQDDTLATLSRAVTQGEQALEAARRQKTAGRANALHVMQFENQLLAARTMHVEALMARGEVENRVNLLLGRFPQPIQTRPQSLYVDYAASISAGVPSELLRNRPDIREAESLIAASKFDVEAARAAFLPTISISGGLGLQAFNPAFLATPQSINYSLMNSFSAPLLNHHALVARFRAAKVNQIQCMYEYQQRILNAFMEVSNGLKGMERIGEYVALKKQQREAQERAVGIARKLFAAGKASYLEVLLAQQESVQVQLELTRVVTLRRLLGVGLYKALGGGWQATQERAAPVRPLRVPPTLRQQEPPQ